MDETRFVTLPLSPEISAMYEHLYALCRDVMRENAEWTTIHSEALLEWWLFKAQTQKEPWDEGQNDAQLILQFFRSNPIIEEGDPNYIQCLPPSTLIMDGFPYVLHELCRNLRWPDFRTREGKNNDEPKT